MLLLAAAPDMLRASAGALLMDGVAMPVTRAVGVIWVNRRATSEVRATVQSFLAQLEYFGEICCGVPLVLLAQASSIAVLLACGAGILTLAGALVLRSRTEGDDRRLRLVLLAYPLPSSRRRSGSTSCRVMPPS